LSTSDAAVGCPSRSPGRSSRWRRSRSPPPRR
jgi:hypothetical protein